MQRLNNKITLVTGASQGIGQAIAELFVAEGAIVILSDINDSLGKEVTAKIGGKRNIPISMCLKKKTGKKSQNLLKKNMGN